MNNHNYFMKIAESIALNSKCVDKKVGAILVNDNNIILSTGYNGPPKSRINCSSISSCRKLNGDIKTRDSCFAVHAEQNAIINAAKLGIKIENATMYCTLRPCSICTKMLINLEVKKVIYKTYHEDAMTTKLAQENLIIVEKLIREEKW